jgi:hypothetical protein
MSKQYGVAPRSLVVIEQDQLIEKHLTTNTDVLAEGVSTVGVKHL